MSAVVSDTSPIRCLGFLGRLEILEELFGQILIPPALAAELRRPRWGTPTTEIFRLPFVRVQAPRDHTRVQELLRSLHAGESEAIALAVEVQASALLIDELAGRKMAEQLGLPYIGVLGILLRAKDRGLIGPLAPLMDRLQHELGFFVSEKLRAETLRRAGESP